MAPEVAMEKPYNHKAEVFSFADVLWEMAAHERPFRDLSTDTFTMGLAKGVRPKCNKKWPPELTKLLGECWLVRPPIPHFRRANFARLHAPPSDAAPPRARPQAEPEKRPEFKDVIPRIRAVLADLEVATSKGATSPTGRAK